MNIPQLSQRTIWEEALPLLDGRTCRRDGGDTSFRTKRMTKYAKTQ